MAEFEAAAAPIPLRPHEALSGIFGSISMASWVFLLLPQLIENYRLKTGEGISLTFLFIWFLGDIANLAGASWAHLVPTVIALAVYFCFADVALIIQCVYYNWRNARLAKEHEANGLVTDRPSHSSGTALAEDDDEDDEEPLLSRRESHPHRSNSGASGSNIGLPGSHLRRHSSAYSGRGRTDSLSKILEEVRAGSDSNDPPSKLRAAIKNAVAILLVCGVGTVGWAIAWKTGLWRPAPAPEDLHLRSASGTPVGASILGYISAVAYLGARIPQIWKNWREKSCEGLSLLFFMLSLLGNLSYGAGILCHSLQRQYVITNVPWLIGSLGTMVEDVTIFVQFHIYGDRSSSDEANDHLVVGNGNGGGVSNYGSGNS